jgi:hypothetical protein
VVMAAADSKRSQMKIKGLHLDPARRRLTKDKILEIVSYMSKCGLNTLHLHLTDDQGIGIDLETISFYESGGLTFKDQEEIGEVCEAQGIDIIPEIDIPGHTTALRSIIEDGEYHPFDKMGVITPGLLRESDIGIVLNIFEEVCTRFRVKKYIHMGGDETRGAKRPYFEKIVNEVCDWAIKRNLDVIAWEDILAKVIDPPSNIIIQRWKHRLFPPIAQGLEKIGNDRVIYSYDYYLDTSPDPFTMFRKDVSRVSLGCIACTWGELIGMENVDNVLYPSLFLLGEKWNNTNNDDMTPIDVLKKYKTEMIYSGNTDTWKRRQWTGFMKSEGGSQPRSSHIDTSQPLNRDHDQYPICSKYLIDMTIDIYETMYSNKKLGDCSLSTYKKSFIEAGADEKVVNDLFEKLTSPKIDIKVVKTALRRVQRSQEVEEQMYYKNGLRMVVRELLRY